MTAARRSLGSTLATWLATVTGYLYLVVATVVLGLLAMLTSRLHRMFSVWAWLWAHGWLLASFSRVKASVHPSIEPGASYVIMANHTSYYDVAALLATLPTPTRFLAKHTLFKIPVLGWAMRAGGFVDVDREDLSRSRQSFAASVQGMAGGFSLLVFPEGTRSPHHRLLPFKRGGFLMALKTGRSILPVGIRGAREIQPKGKRWIRPGTIEIVYGEPIDASAYGVRGRAELMEAVCQRIAELSGSPPPGAV